MIAILLQFFGVIITVLCVIDIIKTQNPLGIKFGFNALFSNMLFFIKTTILAFVLLLVLMVLLGIILSSLSAELKLKMIPLLTLFIKIVLVYMVVIFITEKVKDKNIYNNGLYIA
jgi:hypothetical protein